MAPPVVAGAVVVAFAQAWFWIGLRHEWSVPVLGWVPVVLMTLLVAYSCRKVARRPGPAAPVRRFWRDLGSALGLLLAGVFSNAYDALGHGAPTQRIGLLSSLLYMSALGVATWALLRLPAGRRTRSE